MSRQTSSYLCNIPLALDGGLLTLAHLWWAFVRKKNLHSSGFRYYSTRTFRASFEEFIAELPLKAEAAALRDSPVFAFLCDAYHTEDEECMGLLALCNARRQARPATLQRHAYIERTCLLREAHYSFREIIDALCCGLSPDVIQEKDSAFLLSCKEDDFLVEEPSILTMAIVSRVRQRTRI